MNKYSIGERVKIRGYKGNIIDLSLGTENQYKIKFDQSDELIGADDWYSEDSIEPEESYCPICNSVWKKTQSPVVGVDWFDCPICKKTKETIEKELNKNP